MLHPDRYLLLVVAGLYQCNQVLKVKFSRRIELQGLQIELKKHLLPHQSSF